MDNQLIPEELIEQQVLKAFGLIVGEKLENERFLMEKVENAWDGLSPPEPADPEKYLVRKYNYPVDQVTETTPRFALVDSAIDVLFLFRNKDLTKWVLVKDGMVAEECRLNLSKHILF